MVYDDKRFPLMALEVALSGAIASASTKLGVRGFVRSSLKCPGAASKAVLKLQVSVTLFHVCEWQGSGLQSPAIVRPFKVWAYSLQEMQSSEGKGTLL